MLRLGGRRMRRRESVGRHEVKSELTFAFEWELRNREWISMDFLREKLYWGIYISPSHIARLYSHHSKNIIRSNQRALR